MIAHILIPTDFSECSRAGVAYGMQLARDLGARATLLHIQAAPDLAPLDPSAYDVEPVLASYNAILAHRMDVSHRELVALCDEYGSDVEVACELRDGVAHDAICRAADELAADLIVLATHGRGGLSRLFLGSTAERVVRMASCPVLTVRNRPTSTRDGA